MISGHLRERAGALTLNLRRCGNGSSGDLLHGKKGTKFDPDDGLIVGEVGPWAIEKHDRVREIYSRVARRAGEVLASQRERLARATSSCIRALADHVIKDTNQIIEGSAVVAFNAGRASGHPFSEMHLSDLEAQNSAALAQRIKALGGAPTSYVGEASVVVDQVMKRHQSLWPSPCLS